MIDGALCLSDGLGPLESRVGELVREHARLWDLARSGPPFPKRSYSRVERKGLEREIAALVETVAAGKKAADTEGGLSPAGLERIMGGLRPGLRRVLGFVDLPVDAVYDARFVDSTRCFLEEVRAFDPEMAIEPVYQALRNVWIMNTLQYYLGLEIRVTPSIFGYSLIYPYLDNFLDDPAVPAATKRGFVRRLGGWLEGGGETPESALEAKLRLLIGGIERQFPRALHPGVYRSLLAIYNAQIRSLSQQDRRDPPGPAEVLAISLEKGGTSVLADGYLAAGDLSPGAQRFCFGFGTVLQLADDLQDIGEDSHSGSRTLFSGRRRLDEEVDTLCRYAFAVAAAELNPSVPAEKALGELIPKGCALMIMEAAGKHRERFSRGFVRELQDAFPVRFSFAGKLRRNLQGGILTGREKIRDLDPVFVALMTISSRAFVLD